MISQKDIIYLLFTDRFKNGDNRNDYNVNLDDPQGFHGGDFAGIIESIPYFKKLGVTSLWITPVYQNIEYTQNPKFRYKSYHGYWPLNFEKVDRHLHSPDPDIPDGDRRHLTRMVEKLHKNDLKLIMDVVLNHTGYEHHWQQQKPEWFHEPGHDDDVRRYLYGLPDLDMSNPDVIDYFLHNIIDWVNECHIDGIRMDAVKHIDKPFFYHLKASLRGACPGIDIFGEAFDYAPEQVSYYQNFFDFDSMLDFPLKNAAFEVFVNEKPFTLIARPRLSEDETPGVLDMDFRYNNPYRLITFLDNHDTVRFFTSLLDRFGRDGEGRKTALDVYKSALTFLFTCRGIPQLYYGDEIGMEGREDPDNRRDMPWGIFRGNLPDKGRNRDARDIFDHVRKLIELHRNNNSMQYGSLLTLWVDEFLMIYLRTVGNSVIITAFNNGREPMDDFIRVPYGGNTNIPKRIRSIIASRTEVFSELDHNNSIRINEKTFELKLGGKQAEIFVIS